MQPTSHNTPQDPVQSTAVSDTSVQASASAPTLPPLARAPRHRSIFVVIGIVIIALTATLTFWLLTYQKNATAPAQSTTGQSSTASAFTGLTAGIPNYVLRNSTRVNGTSTGYIKRATTASSNSRAIRLAAATTAYDPAIFYTGAASGINQIFVLNAATKQATQMSSSASPASTPVFSSVSQLLAYQQSCQVHIVTTQKTNDALASSSLPVADCYTPLAWSPDGTTIAFYGVTSNAFPDLGLVSKSTLYLYDTTTKKVETIAMPDGYMSLSGGEMKWVDNHMLIAHYVVWGKLAFIEKEAIFAIATTSGKATETPVPASVSLPTIQVVNSRIYAYDNGSHAVMMLSSIDDRTPDVITETDSWSSFLLQSDADTTDQATLYGMSGSAGRENSFSLIAVDADNKTETIAPVGGFSDYALGWGNNLDEIIYMSAKSGESELRQYTLSTKADIALQSHLPLIQ